MWQKTVFSLIIIACVGCSKLPPPPSVWVCTPMLEEHTCLCSLSTDKTEVKEIPIEKCKISFTLEDWTKITSYIKNLKSIIEKQCR